MSTIREFADREWTVVEVPNDGGAGNWYPDKNATFTVEAYDDYRGEIHYPSEAVGGVVPVLYMRHLHALVGTVVADGRTWQLMLQIQPKYPNDPWVAICDMLDIDNPTASGGYTSNGGS